MYRFCATKTFKAPVAVPEILSTSFSRLRDLEIRHPPSMERKLLVVLNELLAGLPLLRRLVLVSEFDDERRVSDFSPSEAPKEAPVRNALEFLFIEQVRTGNDDHGTPFGFFGQQPAHTYVELLVCLARVAPSLHTLHFDAPITAFGGNYAVLPSVKVLSTPKLYYNLPVVAAFPNLERHYFKSGGGFGAPKSNPEGPVSAYPYRVADSRLDSLVTS